MKHSSLTVLYHSSLFLEAIRLFWLFLSRFLGSLLFTKTMESVSGEKVRPERSESVDFVPERDVKFFLWTRLNPEEYQELLLNDPESIKNSHFDPRNPVRFLIHGWLDTGLGHIGKAGRQAYLEKRPMNVISVDWSPGANTPNYFKSRNLIVPVGQFVAQFLDFLVQETEMTGDQVYFVGHSLGAHIAGIVGKHSKTRINSIFGLDPAGPLFFLFQPKERLDVTDAKYVEVLHTSLQGFGKPIGYADFFVNGARVQPGCNILQNCSHLRAIEYWAESINSSVGFWGTPLEDIETMDDSFDVPRSSVRMGGEPSNGGKARGSYKLETNSASPYAMGPVEYDVKQDTERISFLDPRAFL